MSDTQRDREERQHVIEVLQNMVDWMQEIDDIATPERIHALFYAIASIKTDLKYDLLYEETSGQADKQADKTTTKKDLAVDLISKEQTIDRILTYFNHIDKGNDDEWAKGYEAGSEDAIAVIESVPSVTPQEPRKGHWMGDSYGYICSNCEHSLNDLAQSMDYISFSKPKYCPNCGAKMIELQESEEKE